MAENEQPQDSPAPEPNADLQRQLDETNQRYAASSQEAKRLAAENATLRSQFQQGFSPRQDIPQRAADPFSELEQNGIPAGPVREAIQTEIARAFEPIARQINGQVQARNYMLKNYGPDFTKYESDVMSHIGSDPELQQQYNDTFQANPVAAARFAFLEFADHQRRTAPPPEQNGARKQREEQAQAAVPGGRASEGRNPDAPGRDRVSQAWEQLQQDPSNRRLQEQFAKARLSQVVRNEHLFRRH